MTREEEEFVLAEEDEFKAIQDEKGVVHILDGKAIIRISMDYDTWERFTADALERRR